jgi:hypothetical protein
MTSPPPAPLKVLLFAIADQNSAALVPVILPPPLRLLTETLAVSRERPIGDGVVERTAR